MKVTKTIALGAFIAALFMMQFSAGASTMDIAASGMPKIVFENGAACFIDLVDKEREQEQVAIYTRNFGEYTKPFTNGIVELVIVNNIVAYKNTNGLKGTYIPADGYVISYAKEKADLVNNVNIGDEAALINLDVPILPEKYFKLGDLIIPIDDVNSQRNANCIVLYDSSYGKSTKTNGWGMELTVVDGAVCDIADIKNDGGVVDNNSPIPSNGVVISIHSGNSFYNQLHENVKLGDKVTVVTDNMKLYSAGKNTYDAFNPMSIEDNPLAWDKKNDKPYDGFRGPDQIIIYDSSYGDYTGTNPYGYEVAVQEDGKIMNVGGNNLQIPDGGFVISGHGIRANWLQSYARLGSRVILNKEKHEVRIIFTPDSYVDTADLAIEAAQDCLNLAKIQYIDIDYDEIQNKIDLTKPQMQKVHELLSQGEYRELIQTVNDIQNEANIAYYMTFESPKVENRAVWHRPRETSIDEVKQRLDMLQDININTVYLETYWNGYSIYPTNNEIMEHNPIYNGFDVLQAYITEAHARGIKLYAWVEDFLVGQNVAQKKPEWMIESKQGDRYFKDSLGTKYYYLNPALPEVRDFISGMYKELVKKYDIDGMQFDYMRYPESGDYSNDFGYDSYTRQLFKNYAGADPASLTAEDELWQDWCDFRVGIINSFAYRVISEVKSIKPDIQISIDVWPDYNKTIIDTFQNPKDWISQDYINTIIPMSYYLYEQPVVEDINKTQAFAKGHAQVNVGLATTTKPDIQIFLRQIAAARAASANGVGIFELQSLFSGGYDSALKLGVFRQPAITTEDTEQSVNLMFSDILRKIDDIYLKYGGMDNKEAQKYKELVRNIKVDFKNDKDAAKSAGSIKSNIEDLIDIVDSDETLNMQVAAKIKADLNAALNILEEYISNHSFMANHKVREFQAVIPVKMLKEEKEAPLKAKAVFCDNSSAIMYLDSSQYNIITSDAQIADIDDDVLRINKKGRATVIIEILDTFNFDTYKSADNKIRFTVNKNNKDVVASSDLGKLTASDVTDTQAALSFTATVVDSDIAGYTLYRNGKKISGNFDGIFIDENLQPDTIYYYEIRGFDASGKKIFRSNQTTIRTKAKVME